VIGPRGTKKNPGLEHRETQGTGQTRQDSGGSVLL
jgi:hypothetical protein